MGGVIFIFLVALVIVILVTPAIRARFGGQPPPPEGEPRQETPHEVVIRRLDDHRARRNTPRDDATDKKT
jgi:hypothetical protein